jgi:hypothetical protein
MASPGIWPTAPCAQTAGPTLPRDSAGQAETTSTQCHYFNSKCENADTPDSRAHHQILRRCCANGRVAVARFCIAEAAKGYDWVMIRLQKAFAAAMFMLLLGGCGATSSGSARHSLSPSSAGQEPLPVSTKVVPGMKAFPGHTCLAWSTPSHVALAVTPSSPEFATAAQNVCEQLLGAPGVRIASEVPAGYELQCTATEHGLFVRVYAEPGVADESNNDGNNCYEAKQLGYKVVQG